MSERMQYRSIPGSLVGLADDMDDHRVRFTFPMGVVDRHNTVFAPTSFSESLRRDPHPPFLFAHRMDDPVGRMVQHQVIADGPRPRLEVVNKFSDFDAVPSARRAHAQIADGSCSQASFGFSDAEHTAHRSLRGVRTYTKARLRETSCVPAASIPGAKAIALRGLVDHVDPDDLDAALATLDRLTDVGATRRWLAGELDADEITELEMDANTARAKLYKHSVMAGLRR
jgi:HK97 family phage prohead protease